MLLAHMYACMCLHQLLMQATVVNQTQAGPRRKLPAVGKPLFLLHVCNHGQQEMACILCIPSIARGMCSWSQCDPSGASLQGSGGFCQHHSQLEILRPLQQQQQTAAAGSSSQCPSVSVQRHKEEDASVPRPVQVLSKPSTPSPPDQCGSPQQRHVMSMAMSPVQHTTFICLVRLFQAAYTTTCPALAKPPADGLNLPPCLVNV